MGADVIKVESCVRPDGLRYGSPPDGIRGERPYNRGGWFHMLNRNKRGITLDLSYPRGKEIFKDLVKLGDVVIENFSARVMGNLGLDYPVLKEINRRIIMVSMPGFGKTGPYRDYVAFGEIVEPMAGLSSMTGYPDGPPMRPAIAYGDPIAGMNAALAILIALYARQGNGKGQFIDLSHRELVSRFIGEQIMEFTMNGRLPKRLGNGHSSMAPHGCYRCKGDDRWVAIAIGSDEEWKKLCQVTGNLGWAEDDRFSTILKRWEHHDLLDKEIEQWTSQHNPSHVMTLLQGVGIKAGVVMKNADLFTDPHLKDRGFFEMITHTDAGTFPHAGMMFKLSKTPGSIRSPAPRLGEYNSEIFQGLLKLSEEEVKELETQGIIGTVPTTIR